MTALTEAHLDKLTDEDLRALALRILNDAVNTLNTSMDEHGLTDHPDLDPAPVHEAANSLRKALTNPDNGYNRDTWERYSDAVDYFISTAYNFDVPTGNGGECPPQFSAWVVYCALTSVYHRQGTPHRPYVWWLHNVLDRHGGGFMPGHETTVGYVLNTICGPADPRLPALTESYLQSGLHEDLRPAIDEATQQLARLDELTDLNRRLATAAA